MVAKNTINYVEEWVRIFNQVLGWSPYQTMQWIDRNDMERGLDEFVCQETPLYWAIPEFIPIKLRRELDVKEILAMQHDIWKLYRCSSSYGQSSNYRAFRIDLNRYLIRKYNVELDVSSNV